MITNSNL